MKDSIFEYKDYKALLRDSLDRRGEGARGERSRLAEAIPCHTAYVSQVLNGTAHFSLEQGERIAQFFEFNRDQALFLFLLIQFDRAGTTSLKRIFEDQINATVEKQFVLKNRLEFKKTLSREDQAIFYSSWHYGAIHVMVSVPGCNTERGISRYLGIPVKKVAEIFAFLTSVGLVVKRGAGYEIGTSHIHLESDSPMISKHHTNWKIRTIQSLDNLRQENLHYSSVITASREDSVKIRSIMVKAIEDVRKVVKGSVDEAGFCYSLDFFGLQQE